MLKRLSLIAAFLAIAPALAEEQGPVAGWQTWTADGSCYALVYPSSVTGGRPGTKGDRAYIAVKHVPREGTWDGIAVASGMDVPVGAEATIDVGGKEFPLLVFKGAGFVRTAEDKMLVEALSKAEEARVSWMFRDELTVQTYRFKGFEAAHRTIDAGCPRAKSADASADAPKAVAADPAPKASQRRLRRSRHARN